MPQFVIAGFILTIHVFAAIHIQEEEKKRKREKEKKRKREKEKRRRCPEQARA
jgi:large-conductance mechanosensitive channel